MDSNRIIAALLIPIYLVQGCASSGKSTLTGMGVGAGLGAGIGAIADPGPKGEGRIRNVFIGATAGSLVGAGAGYLTHGMVEKHEKEAYEKGKKDGEKTPQTYVGSTGEPQLLPPRIETRFVDDQVRGSTFIPAHFEYLIVEPARWNK